MNRETLRIVAVSGLRILAVLAVALGAVYALLAASLYFFQERFLFFPRRFPPDAAYPFRANAEEHAIEVAGARLSAVLFRSGGDRGVVLYWHGNGGCLADWAPAAGPFLEKGFDVFLPDYRGYGKSTGRNRGEAQLLADAETVYRWVAERYPEDRIVLVGRSLGAAVALALARRHRPARVILEAPFFSGLDMKRMMFPAFPDFLVRYPLRSDLWVRKVRCPVFLIHGTEDTIIPFRASERLFPLLPAGGALWPVPGAGHNDLSEKEIYESALASALGPRLGARGTPK